MRFMKQALVTALFVSVPAAADTNFRKQLAKPIVAVLSSSKTPDQLELCAADAVGVSFLPLPIADGRGGVLLFGFGGMMGASTVHRVVSLIKTGNGTRIEVRTFKDQPDRDLIRLLTACS